MTVFQASSYIFNRYLKECGEFIDEMKLHKLLYFAQRESLIRNNVLLFSSQFEGWKYGPVMKCVRSQYATKSFQTFEDKDLTPLEKEVFNYVFSMYAAKEAWSLSRLTHGEYSWKKSREGVEDNANGENEILNSDILVDAKRIKIKRMLLSINAGR